MVLKKIIVLAVMLLHFTVSSVYAAAPLEREIKADLNQFDGKVGIYAKNLRTGKVIEYNENYVFPAASTSKLVVALATYKYLYPIVGYDKRNTYADDISSMMVVSDNASFARLLDEIDTYNPNALDKVARDLKLKKTKIHSEAAFNSYNYHSVTTPVEMAKVFETIYREKYLGKEKSNALKYELANTIFHDEIPRHMLTPVMHKVGELDDVLCDVGIVDDGRDQILISAYTRTQQPSYYASDFIANISAKLYNALRRK